MSDEDNKEEKKVEEIANEEEKKSDESIEENSTLTKDSEDDKKDDIEDTEGKESSENNDKSDSLEKEKEVSDTNNEENIDKKLPDVTEEKEKHKRRDSIVYEECNQIAVKDNSHKKKRVIIFICIVVFLLIISIPCIFIIYNKTNENVYKNVYVLGENLSNKTTDELVEILNKKSNELVANRSLDIYQDTEKIYQIKAEEIGFKLDVEKTIQNIMKFARTGNVIEDNILILKTLFSSKEILPEYEYSEEKLKEVVKNIDLSIDNRFVDDSYSIDEEKKILIIVNGTTGYTINYDNECESIYKAFCDNSGMYLLSLITKEPSEVGVDEIYQKVKKEPKDAYMDTSVTPNKFVSEVYGVDLDVAALKEFINNSENQEEGKTLEFALTVVEPKVKLTDLTYKMYNDKLSGCTTYFDTGSAARVNNLGVALRYLNEVIVMPGEIFSYNNVIGETTYAKGYLGAATFKAGKVVNELGGGICQTTSTLYDAALMANLEIVERHQHGLPVGYVRPSLDATVYSPVLDFKFKNNRTYPIKIVTSFSPSGSLNISIFGTKEENDLEVILSSKYISTIPFETQYVYDQSLPNGTQIVETSGVNGYVSEGYITKKQNGVVVSSEMLSRDTYKAVAKVVRVGTGG